MNALSVGYRLIDTASAYNNEEAVGYAIYKSGILREDIILTTKLWIQDYGYKKTQEAFHQSIKRLGVDYLDLYLIHQLYNDIYSAWRAMEELYKEEKIRAIGVSNFKPDRLIDLMQYNEINPAINQIEIHPFNQQIETDKYQKENGVQTESWRPFAEGKNEMFSNPILLEIAKKHEKSVAQVILGWLIQRDIVAIPKSINKNRMEENFNIFDFALTYADMEIIRTLDTRKSVFLDHSNPETIKWFSTITYPI